ncbi:MAG: response regulator [Chthoniobacteraceae bacterium]
MKDTGTVLIVDDDGDLADALKGLLELRGYTVATANSGAAGLEAVRTSAPDAIVCDMIIKDMRGDEFFKTVTTEKPELASRFIFSTGHSDQPRVMEFFNESDADMRILFKPFGEDELVDSVRAVTQG